MPFYPQKTIKYYGAVSKVAVSEAINKANKALLIVFDEGSPPLSSTALAHHL